MVVPQVVDPLLDRMTYALMSRLRSGVDTIVGVHNAHRAVHQRRKPVVLIMTTEAHDQQVARIVGDLPMTAIANGVPVIYSLTQEFLGSAAKKRTPQMVVAIMDVPDAETLGLLTSVMKRAAGACTAFLEKSTLVTQECSTMRTTAA